MGQREGGGNSGMYVASTAFANSGHSTWREIDETKGSQRPEADFTAIQNRPPDMTQNIDLSAPLMRRDNKNRAFGFA